jgi:hypothetical protein
MVPPQDWGVSTGLRSFRKSTINLVRDGDGVLVSPTWEIAV